MVCLVIPDPEGLAGSNKRSSNGLWQHFSPLGAFMMDLSWQTPAAQLRVSGRTSFLAEDAKSSQRDFKRHLDLSPDTDVAANPEVVAMNSCPTLGTQTHEKMS